MSHVLGDRSNAIAESLAITGVESSASIVGQDDENRELVITIRKRIQGITVSASPDLPALGSIG